MDREMPGKGMGPEGGNLSEPLVLCQLGKLRLRAAITGTEAGSARWAVRGVTSAPVAQREGSQALRGLWLVWVP